MNKVFLAVVIVGGIILVAGWFFVNNSTQTEVSIPTRPTKTISSFEECAASGAPVAESYPRMCRDAKGQIFIESIGNASDQADKIRVLSPTPNQVLTSPLHLLGEARGNWFFEASFPVVLLDSAGQEIARGRATADGEWMTTEFVPFRATLPFTKPLGETGTLLLERDNPSGLPENADALTLPVRFTP